MSAARSVLVAVAFGVLVAAGCGPAKLNMEKTYPMNVGDSNNIDLPAIAQAQKITVDFSSSATEVTIFLIKDFKEDDRIDIVPKKDQILAKAQGKSGTLSADVPEKTATRVIITDPRGKTDVTVKLTNAK
jgi:hypothetical protein